MRQQLISLGCSYQEAFALPGPGPGENQWIILQVAEMQVAHERELAAEVARHAEQLEALRADVADAFEDFSQVCLTFHQTTVRLQSIHCDLFRASGTVLDIKSYCLENRAKHFVGQTIQMHTKHVPHKDGRYFSAGQYAGREPAVLAADAGQFFLVADGGKQLNRGTCRPRSCWGACMSWAWRWRSRRRSWRRCRPQRPAGPGASSTWSSVTTTSGVTRSATRILSE